MGRRIQGLSIATVAVVCTLAASVFATEVTNSQSNKNIGAGSATVLPPATSQNAKRRSILRFLNPQSSAECKVKSPYFEGRAPLRSVRRAILQKRPVRVMALGSASLPGVTTGSPRATYPIRLENGLEGVIDGLKVEMIARGLSGEVADDAVERIKADVAEVRPDLVVWQVGTNDAVARTDVEHFGELLRETLSWLAAYKIDVVLIDPQYVERLANDPNYTGIVNEIATVASERRVLLVNRYDAMADLARQNPGASRLANDRFRLADLGYQCMAEYAAKAITAGILQADTEKGLMQ